MLCSGKVFYDLLAARGERTDVALVRVEQLFPFPEAEIRAALARHPNAELVWCQEEPANMGAATFVRMRMPELRYIGRPAAAAPATGSLQAHKAQQQALVREAME